MYLANTVAEMCSKEDQSFCLLFFLFVKAKTDLDQDYDEKKTFD